MKEQFHFSIEENINPQDNSLAIQAGNHHFSYCIYNVDNRNLLQLKRYTFKNLTSDLLENILELNPVLDEHFDKIIIELDFGFSALLPSEMSNSEATPLMYLENADQQDHVITEYLEEKGIANIYTVPPNILTWMVHHFPSANYLHAHSVMINAVTDMPENGLINVDFSDSRFTVAVFKSSGLLLAKTYPYSSSTDVVFYLLKICEAFQLSQHQVAVEASGLIDIDSKLYSGLYDYFLHISLKPANWTDDISGLPAHYFTSLNELVVCGLLQET